jgi:hypothetical protein
VNEILPQTLPEPIAFKSQRQFVREVLSQEIDLRAKGTEFVNQEEESVASKIYRERVNADGAPSEIVALDYIWIPGGELNHRKDQFLNSASDSMEKGAAHERLS